MAKLEMGPRDGEADSCPGSLSIRLDKAGSGELQVTRTEQRSVGHEGETDDDDSECPAMIRTNYRLRSNSDDYDKDASTIKRTPRVILEQTRCTIKLEGQVRANLARVGSNLPKPSSPYHHPSQAAASIPSMGLLLAIMLDLIAHCSTSTLTDFDGATFYKAPVGSRVRIACNGSHWNDDSVSLVLWFKGTVERHSAPIYTIDARQKPLSNGARHFVADNYKGRAKFVAKASPPYLDLAPLQADDQAEYRCRIDYRSKPRENFLIILFVLVPPRSVQITDSAGRSLEQIYGPLSESSDLTLVCLSKGGRPAPSVTWRQRAKVIDDSYLTLNDFLALEQSGQLLAKQRRQPPKSSQKEQLPRPRSPTNSGFGGRLEAANLQSSQSKSHLNLNLNSTLPNEPTDLESSSEQSKSNLAHDNNQVNSINAFDPSLASLESLWLDWRSWPEFERFGSELAPLSDHEKPPAELTRKWQLASNRQRPNGSGSSEPLANSNSNSSNNNANAADAANAANGNSNPSQTRQLLSMEVHESITTAVNVLRLTSLSGLSTLTGSAADDEQRASDTFHQVAQGGGGDLRPGAATWQPQLECQASNLHYDLRALIKLFAPPSLVGVRRQSGSAPAERPSQLLESGEPPLVSSRQLAAAIERALESLLSVDDWPTWRAMPEQLVAGELGHGDGLLAATALRQIKMDSNGSSPGAAAIIYQQLARPHQLAAETLAAADSSNQTAANFVQSKSIALDIYVPPSEVRIIGAQRALSANQQAEFQCTASGSRPAAKLSWLKSGQLLDAKLWRQVDESTGNWSRQSSRLSLQLGPQDHGAKLQCLAENEQLAELQSAKSAPIEDSRTLIVHYAPQVKLELGNKMLSNAIKEGSDIYFVCHVEAVPAIREITWLHNERPLNESSGLLPSGQVANLNEGLIISNNSLVLQRVRLEQRGFYACLASNSEGLSESNRIELRVLHAPICAPIQPAGSGSGGGGGTGQPTDNGPLLVESKRVPIGAQVRLLCRMEADPADLELSWYLNSTANERRPLFAGNNNVGQQSLNRKPAPANAFQPDQWETQQQTPLTIGEQNENTNNKTSRLVARAQTTTLSGHSASSQLNYLLDTHLDYGRLYCVARNSIGEQSRACVYDIQRPEEGGQAAPSGSSASCVAVNVTSSSVWIACERAPRESPPPLVYRYNVELFRADHEPTALVSGSGIVDDYYTDSSGHVALNPAWAPDGAQLEANLTSDNLEEPLFALTNLRPASRYAIKVHNFFEPIEEGEQAAFVDFSTSRAESAGEGRYLAGLSRPSLEPVADAHQAKLLSALISTRSADGAGGQQRAQVAGNQVYSMHQRNLAGQHLQQQQLRGQQPKQDQPNRLLASFWSATTSSILRALHLAEEPTKPPTSGSSGSQRLTQAAARQRDQQQLATGANGRRLVPFSDTSSGFLLITICLLVFSSLALLLLLNHYMAYSCFTFAGGAKNRSKRLNWDRADQQTSSSSDSLGGGSSSGLSLSKVNCAKLKSNALESNGSARRHLSGSDTDSSKRSGKATANDEKVPNQSNGYRSTTTPTSIHDQHESASAAAKTNYPAQRGNQLSASLTRSAAAQVIASHKNVRGASKTLDRCHASQPIAGQQQPQRTSNGNIATDANTNTIYGPTDHVNKSRSTKCLETLVPDTCERVHQLQQQQQQRLVQLTGDVDRCLIGDANLSLFDGQSTEPGNSCRQTSGCKQFNWHQCVQCDDNKPGGQQMVGTEQQQQQYHHYGSSSRLTQTPHLSKQYPNQAGFAAGYVLCDVQRDCLLDYGTNIQGFVRAGQVSTCSAQLSEKMLDSSSIMDIASGQGASHIVGRQFHEQMEFADGQHVVASSKYCSHAASQPKQMLEFVVVQPENGYGVSLASPADQQQTGSPNGDPGRCSKISIAQEVQGALPIHQVVANGDGQSSSLISDESSELNGHYTWSLSNGQADNLQQAEQMQYIELFPTVGYINDNDSSLIGRMGQFNSSTCSNFKSKTLVGTDSFGQQIDDGHHQQETRSCISLASPSVNGSTSTNNDLVILSPSSLTNTASSNTDSILRSNSACPNAKQDPAAYDNSTMKRNGTHAVNHGYRTNPTNTGQLTSILKNTNTKHQVDCYELSESRQSDCQCIANDATNINFKDQL